MSPNLLFVARVNVQIAALRFSGEKFRSSYCYYYFYIDVAIIV